MLVATCEICRFDAAAYTLDDVRGTVRNAADRIRWTVEHLPEADVDVSAAHAIADQMRRHTERLTAGRSAARAPEGRSFADALRRIDDAAADLDRAIAQLGPSDAVSAVAREAAHSVEHALRVAGRTVAQRQGAATADGVVVGIFASNGGVPKRSIDEAEVGYRGIVGDRQASRKHHGRVWQALCLWSSEVIESLRAEGHPIHPGAAGENIVVQGIEWATIRPGVRLGIGPEVVVEVTAYAAPCTKNAQWFSDRRSNRIEHDRRPGWSRVYAAVMRDGAVRPGDAVTVQV